MNVKRTERGYAGHFICADRCRFKRNTLLEFGESRIVVSTVGSLVIDNKIETIGCNRHYETMAFSAQWEDPYWEANVCLEISVKSFSLIGTNRESDRDADEMHEVNVSDMIDRMLRGEAKPYIYEP